MNIESTRMIIVAVATPVTAIVAFYIQLKNVKGAHLKTETYTRSSLPKEENKKYGKKRTRHYV